MPSSKQPSETKTKGKVQKATKDPVEPAKVKAPKDPKVKASKGAKSGSSSPPPAPPVEPSVVEPAVVEPAVEPVVSNDVEVSGFTSVVSRLQEMMTTMSLLKNEVKQLEKKCLRELKVAEKSSGKRKREQGSRPASGFVKPTKISDELAVFLGKDKGSEMARTEVTKELNVYIKAHKLQDPSNGRTILPDTKLNNLLKVEKDTTLTYFNLQRYMSPHFAKASAKPVNA